MNVNKKHIGIGIVIIAAVMLFVFVFKPVSFSSLIGFSTLSLTQGTNYISSDQFYNGPSYSLVLAVDGSSGSAIGTITPDMVAEFTGNQKPSGPFDIKVEMLNQSCVNTMLNNSQLVYSYDIIQYSVSPGSDGPSGGCGAYGAYQLGQPTTSGSVYGITKYYTCAKRKIDGELFVLDTATHYDSKIKVTLITQNGSNEIYLGSVNQNAEIPNVLRANIIGALQGSQSCPTPAVDTIIYRPYGSTDLQLKNKAFYSSIYAESQSQASSIEQANQFNNDLNSLKNSNAPSSSYCDLVNANPITTQYKCTPISPVAIPIIKLIVKASELGIVVPTGMPKIESYEVPTFTAANTGFINVKVKNIANQADSFDVSIAGKNQVNIQSTRIALGANEETIAKVPIQGSGIIGNYTILVVSVNNPNNQDSMQIKLMINPFCDKQPETGKVLVSTEVGCYYLCANELQTDIREKTCQPFGTFEQNGAYITWETSTTSLNQSNHINHDYAGETHCLDIGKYTSMNNYMDAVASGKIQAFLPKSIENTYWLPSPICKYVGAYGFTYNDGIITEVTDQIYQSSAVLQSNLNGANSIISIPSQLNNSQSPSVPVNPSGPSIGTNYWLLVIPVIPILISIVYLFNKFKKRNMCR